MPKNEIDQKLCLALIVALLISQSPRYTRVISTSSIFSAGRRWCCVGGGGAARTCNSQNQPVTTTKRPNSIRNPSHCLHRPPGSSLQMMHTNRLCIQLDSAPGLPSSAIRDFPYGLSQILSPGCNPTSILPVSMDKPGCKPGKDSSHAESDGAFAWNFCAVAATRMFCCI